MCIITDEYIFSLLSFVNCKRGFDIDVRISEFVVAENIDWIYGTKLADVTGRRNCILDAFVIRTLHSWFYGGAYVKEV